jgi:pilus assembly protein CpaC
MDVKKLVLLIGALIVAAVTAVTAKNMFSGAGAPSASARPAVPAGPEVLVATRALPVGTIIDAEAFRFQRWPEGLVQPAYYIKGKPGREPADLIGTVVRNEITAGQPLTQGSLIKPGERGFLAAALGPGMRAVTVAVSATSGVAGFVFPGDRVDIVLTQEVPGGGDGTPAQGFRDHASQRPGARHRPADDAKGEDGKAVVQRFSMVTLEATPKIAEKIAVAQTIGSLSLSLRSIADNSAELERAIASGEVRCRRATIPGPSAGCCSRSPTGRSTPRPPIRSARTSPASSAAPCPARAPRRRRTTAVSPMRSARSPPPPPGVRPAARLSLQSPAVRSSGSPAATASPSFRSEPSKMSKLNIMRRATVGTAIAAVIVASLGGAASAPALAQTSAGTYRPTNQVLLSVGEGQLISLPRSVVDVWTSNPGVADVNVTSPRQLGLFGKDAGEATVIATAADGSVVWGAHVRVSQNISSIDEMLRAAMPDSKITVTHVGQIAVINGTVASPADSAQAEQLVRAMLNPGIEHPGRRAEDHPGQPPQDGDSAAGDAARQDRRGEPLARPRDRSQSGDCGSDRRQFPGRPVPGPRPRRHQRRLQLPRRQDDDRRARPQHLRNRRRRSAGPQRE